MMAGDHGSVSKVCVGGTIAEIFVRLGVTSMLLRASFSIKNISFMFEYTMISTMFE